MKKFKKFISVFLSAVMVTCMLVLPASATLNNTEKSNATAMTSGKTYSKDYGYFYSSNSGTTKVFDNVYKFEVAKDGDVTININSKDLAYYEPGYGINYYLYNQYDSIIEKHISAETTKGSFHSTIYRTNYHIIQPNKSWQTDATYKYYLEKGTYYIHVYANPRKSDYFKNVVNNNQTCNISVKATFPSASTAEVTEIYFKLSKGSKVTLGAFLSGGSGTVKWSSSNSSVASVSSSGTVTAKKAGTATITAKVGSSTQKIKVKVS